MEQKNAWTKYNHAGSVAPARPRLVNTLEKFCMSPTGHALDLGCGGGRDTRELLARGWQVDAVDSDPSAIDLTLRLEKEWPGKLKVISANFEVLTLKKDSYDLVNASFSLPFCQPIRFGNFWKEIKNSLRPGGVISCELFGNNDSWRKNSTSESKLTFLDKAEVEELASGLILEVLKETEEDGPSFSEPMKHWHIFTLIARRPTLAVPFRSPSGTSC
jgi:tellurite methyltransferase